MRRFVVFFLLLSLYRLTYSLFIEGDILVHVEKDLESDLDIAGGVKLADPSKLWPGGFVYYRCHKLGSNMLSFSISMFPTLRGIPK